MKIYTLNVGQGQFVAITGPTEAIIIDTLIPLNPNVPIINVKAALTDILKGKNFIGLVITGFDSDHLNEIGVRLVMNKYRPDWIMYPKYYKDTNSATAAFAAINEFDKQNSIKRFSMHLGDNNLRFFERLSNDFTFELFSPHKDDMNSSNNCSIVCKVTERSTGGSYLITGDTECERWDNIVRIFGNNIKSDVLDAPHHGSKNGITQAAINAINPHTVLISAGVNNKFGHPDKEAMQKFCSATTKVFQTNYGSGQSILTEITKTLSGRAINSTLYDQN